MSESHDSDGIVRIIKDELHYSADLVRHRVLPAHFHHTTSETDLQGGQDQLTDVDRTEVVGHHHDEVAVIHGDAMAIPSYVAVLHADLPEGHLAPGRVAAVGVDKGSHQAEDLGHRPGDLGHQIGELSHQAGDLGHLQRNLHKKRNFPLVVTEGGKLLMVLHHLCSLQHHSA